MDQQQESRLPQTDTIYICNGECRAEQQVRPNDAVRCNRCGHRILLKRRDRKMMVYDAR